MFDLILKNGTLVNEGKIFESDIAIKGNRIEKIAASIDSESKNVVDLNGKYVIPGIIDDQVNFTNITSFMSSNCGDYDYKMNIVNNIIYNIIIKIMECLQITLKQKFLKMKN